MSLKAKIEALIYAAEEPIGLDQLASLLKEDLLALKERQQSEAAAALAAAAAEGASVETEGASVDQENPPETAAGPETANAPEPSAGPETATGAIPAADKRAADKKDKAELRNLLKPVLEEVIAACAGEDRGVEIRKVAGGYRMSTKPEHHDVVRAFAKSLKPPIRLSLQALETLAVIAYKQPVTVPEISEIRGVDSSGVIGTLFDRKLITTAGRKAVIGRPMLYKTTKDFLMRFGLSDLSELPSIEEFEKLAAGDGQAELFDTRDAAIADATGIPSGETEPGAGSSGTSEESAAGDIAAAEPPEIEGAETAGIAASEHDGN